jgi:hypothetical protein
MRGNLPECRRRTFGDTVHDVAKHLLLSRGETTDQPNVPRDIQPRPAREPDTTEDHRIALDYALQDEGLEVAYNTCSRREAEAETDFPHRRRHPLDDLGLDEVENLRLPRRQRISRYDRPSHQSSPRSRRRS